MIHVACGPVCRQLWAREDALLIVLRACVGDRWGWVVGCDGRGAGRSWQAARRNRGHEAEDVARVDERCLGQEGAGGRAGSGPGMGATRARWRW